MSCSNCFNGCPEILSDKCVKYTGIDVEVLGIQNGDSLSYVEQALITFLVSTLDGTGIKLELDQEIICTLVQENLPTCGDLTLVDVLNTLIKCICSLKTDLNNLSSSVATLITRVDDIEAEYNVSCLTGVTSTSGTHDVLQALITRVCTLITSLPATYVKLVDLNSLIQDYLDAQDTSSKYYTKMIPYTVVEYYGSLANFDVTGAGLGDWEQIYLCNGLNGTPDKRGRTAVGATNGVGGGAYDPAVDPAISGNPTYVLNTKAGANNVTLSVSQMPSHTHTATAVVTDPGHTHTISDTSNGESGSGKVTVGGAAEEGTPPTTDSATTGISVAVTNASNGGGLAHPNIQPSLACYYIMYIPS